MTLVLDSVLIQDPSDLSLEAPPEPLKGGLVYPILTVRKGCFPGGLNL